MPSIKKQNLIDEKILGNGEIKKLIQFKGISIKIEK